MVDPILKWAGGKRSLIPDILALLPANYRNKNYHEPFIGGGAIFFKIRPRSGSINDINHRLMNFYKVVRDKPDELISLTKTYIHEKDTFYKLRERFNEPNLSDLEDASLLLYLNKTAFNGLYRVNSKGKFNVPFGRYKNPKIVPERRIRATSNILKNIDILCTDFSYIVDYSQQGDIVYFDPPYQPVSQTANFTSYSSGGFDINDQIRLRDTCLQLDNKGVQFVLSNSYIEEILNLYQEIERFNTKIVQAKRAISSKASTRGPINEILVTNIAPSNKKIYSYKLSDTFARAKRGKIMPSFIRNININEKSRNDLRKAVIEELLKEQPGTGKREKKSHYTYYVEKLSNGNKIFLTRPAFNKMGFDFVIHVENMRFSNNKDNPSHKDIFNDLKKKKSASLDKYQILYNAINDVYNCVDPDIVLKNIGNLTFNVGYDVEMILKVIKWFFIEQDIRYWNYSGRHMFKEGVDKI